MKAIILNYNDCSVNVAELPDNCDTNEKVEEHLSVELGYRLDEISYMTPCYGDDIPVYRRTDAFHADERIATL